MAGFVRVTRVPVAWAELTWHFISLFLILWACNRIARALFDDARAELASMALLAAMFTLPVAGTALTLVDQYLHPRALATAFVLIAVERILAGRRWQAIPLLLLAFAVHPIMAAMGASFCFFLILTTEELLRKWLDGENRIARWIRPQNKIRVGVTSALASAMPLSWVFDAPNPSWRRALDAKDYLHLSRWAWYEWLGALAPILLFWLLWRVAMRRGERVLARFSLAVFLYGVSQLSFALMLGSTPALIRFLPLQPMRFLHLVYFFLVLVGGGLLGRFVLRTSIWRWALFLLIINGAMFYAQRQLFSESPHIELPGRLRITPGCRLSIGSGRTLQPMLISPSALITWPRLGRTFTVFVHSPNEANWPMPIKIPRLWDRCRVWPLHGRARLQRRRDGKASGLRTSDG